MIIDKPLGVVGGCSCNGGKFFLVHDTNGKLLFHGSHGGQVVSSQQIEKFDTEEEMLARATALGLEIPEDE